MTSFNDRLRRLIQQQVTAGIAAALGDIIDATGEDESPKGRPTNGIGGEDDDVTERPDMGSSRRQSKKRGRGRATRVYALVPVKKGHRRVAPKLHRTAQMVWEFIKENGPSTAQDIEAGTELGKKTVESSVWFLRNSGHIVSKPIDAQ